MASPPAHDDDLPRASLGWQLVLLRALASHAGALANGIEGRLAAFDPEALNGGEGVALRSAELNQVVDGALELQDLADVIGVIAGSLPSAEELLVLSAEEVADEAARALRAGSAHRRAVVLSAQLLRPATGFPALADAITSDTSLVTRWDTLTVRELLTAFRDCDAPLLQRTCRAAGIQPDDEWATLEYDAVVRVATALRSAADA
ncbi:MAG TPA: hypothetical protein VKB25_03895 [Conexibacter sp.]|nr:hypothetical protein [Conexibacter sp.]